MSNSERAGFAITRRRKKLRQYIKERANQASFPRLYLRAGPGKSTNEERTLNGRMTPELFEKFFLVKRSPIDEEEYSSKIERLFNDPGHNLLAVQAGSGSGKSVFINTIANHKTDYEYHVFDLEDKSGSDQFPHAENIVSFQLKRLYRRIAKNNEWVGTFNSLLCAVSNYLSKFGEDDVDDSKWDFIRACLIACDVFLTEQIPVEGDYFPKWNRRFTEAMNRIEINDDTVRMKAKLLMFTLGLLAEAKMSSYSKKYIIAFDNLEAYVTNSISRIRRLIENSHMYFSEIFNELSEGRDVFYYNFTFVFMIRTATCVAFTLPTQHTDLWSGRDFIIELSDHDFLLKALLKKLAFISDISDSSLYKYLYSILKMVMPSESIQKYLKDPDLVDKKRGSRYFDRRFMPFFNDDYRKTVDHILLLARNTSYMKTISTLLANSEEFSTVSSEIANGIHMVLFRAIYDKLQQDHILSSVGFHDLSNHSGGETYGVSRSILIMLYWDEWKLLFSGRRDPLTLRKFLTPLKYYYRGSEKETTLVDALYNLSAITGNGDSAKERIIYNWTNLISFKNLTTFLTKRELDEIIKACFDDNEQAPRQITTSNGTNVNLDDIRVQITPAGICFVQYAMRSVEFILSRGVVSSPLFSYATKDGISDDNKAELDLAIDNIHDTVLSGITDMLRDAWNTCYENTECSPTGNICSSRDCFFCERQRVREANREYMLFSCSLFQRYQEGLIALVDIIDYLDRFRLYACTITASKAEAQKSINEFMLDKIKLFGDAFDRLNNVISDNNFRYEFEIAMKSVASNAKKKFGKQEELRIPRTTIDYYDTKDDTKNAKAVLADAIESCKKNPLCTI